MLTLAEARIWMGLDAQSFCRRLSELLPAVEPSMDSAGATGATGAGGERGTVCSAAAAVFPARLRDAKRCVAEAESARGQRCLSHEMMRRLVAPARRAIITVGIQKGGVGKTVIALNLAAALAAAGLRTVLIDCDPQASATNFLLPDEVDYATLPTVLEVCCEEGVSFGRAVTPTRIAGLGLVAAKPLIRKADARLRSTDAPALLRQKMADLDCDCLVFDVPPGFGELVRAAYLLSTLVVMPVLPDAWAIESTELTREEIADAAAEAGVVQPAIYLLLNRFRPGRLASNDALAVLEESYRERILPVTLPETALIQNAINNGQVLLDAGAPALREAFLELSALLWRKTDEHA